MKRKECNCCNKGPHYGHDSGSKPTVKIEAYVDDEGRHRKRHTTLQQGSGCLLCGGIGYVEVKHV